jgi:hypothetical protein
MNGVNKLMFVMMKCGVLFEVRAELDVQRVREV